MAYSGIANEGLIYKPYIVKKVLDIYGKTIKEGEPKLVRDLSKEDNDSDVLITKENFKIVKQALRRVANGPQGTAKWWKIPGVEFAGKTGTSQFFSLSADKVYEKCEERPFEQRHHGWFVGYAPAENPMITVAVLAEHSCHGSTGGAPVVRDLMWSYFEKYHPEMLKWKRKKVKKAVAKKKKEPKKATKPNGGAE